MNKFIILDRDGVLNEDPGYVHKIKDFKLFDGVIEALKSLKDFKFIIITNQSGIGRGYYKEKDFHKFNNHLVNELKKQGIKIEKTYFCPHHPEENCDCRKPNIKFIEQAKKEFDIDLKKSFVIGDHPHDVGLGKNANAKTIYLLSGHGKKHFKELSAKPDFITTSLLEAARFINQKKEKIKTRGEIKKTAEKLKRQGKKVVTCNGCFDILHPGHIYFLKEAKKQGNILIVGLNSDSSVKENKGPKRPINNENARAAVLSALDMVDYVVIFDEKTPIELLEAIKPDVHCNGEEYGYGCIEAPTVKKYRWKIHLIKNYKGLSTTKIIEGSI